MTRGRSRSTGLYARAMREAEVRIWKKAIASCRGDVARIAEWLSVTRAWVYMRIHTLSLDPELERARSTDARPDDAA